MGDISKFDGNYNLEILTEEMLRMRENQLI